MAETSTIFGFMKYVSATDILSDFKKTVDSYFVNSLRKFFNKLSFFYVFFTLESYHSMYELFILRIQIQYCVHS